MTGTIADSAQQRLAAQARYPYDAARRSDWADKEFIRRQGQFALGSREMARFLLTLIGNGFPSPLLTEAYFSTLDLALRDRQTLTAPGQLVLGFGTGRTGSTSLAALLSTIPGCLATHENPCPLFWSPLVPQIEFHLRRFRRLTQHFSVVFDIAHWWLPAFSTMRHAFPDLLCLGLERDELSCVRSFLRIKQDGNFNHWAPPNNGIWSAGLWDPTYPTYPLTDLAETSPAQAKEQAIARYVRDYCEQMRQHAEIEPHRWRVVRTEDLSRRATQQAIFAFLGRRGRHKNRRYNIGSTADSERMSMVF